ncbi:acetylornithine deacetylase [Sphingomonas naphthae]|uniref:Acetylornithine deacetylase n=1 Tax=Sphingomonas naphthae TaxID=1813468 RepID=A0ABY7TK37_9SPHN|nr:acetylornithine deacetylase [Sphingomonas naphthae]WCT73077.1 acetylornithine deacetylase [Sphingomonas naphthae]
MTSIDILERLIAFPTVSGTPNAELIDHVEGLLRAAGASVTRITGPLPGSWNLWATLGPADRPGIVLSGHSDVVPVAGQPWTMPPFALTRQGDRLFGRGTADMKGFVACAIAAFLRASERAADLRAPLHLALSCEEEVGCVGVRSLLDELERLPVRPLFCLVGEPTSMRLATGHKGKLAARVTCAGRAAHSALPHLGLNAIHLAADFVTAARAEQERLARDGRRDDAFEVPFSTLHVGTIRGGTALNIVPDSCALDIELRTVPGEDGEAVMARLRDAADAIVAHHAADFPEAAILIEPLNAYPGLDSPDGPWLRFLASLTGANDRIKLAFGTEGGLFDDKLGRPVMICGPGSMDQGHKPDEYVTVDQLARCDAMLGALVDWLCRAGDLTPD